MTVVDEHELRRRFAQLREADQEGAPQFAQTFEQARSRRVIRTTLRLRPLVVAAAVAIAIAAGWSARARWWSPVPVTPSIATWRAPTDFLLRVSASDLVGVMPALGASVLDTILAVPSKRGA